MHNSKRVVKYLVTGILFFSIYSKATAFTMVTVPDSTEVAQIETSDRTYILKMSGVRDEEKAHMWAERLKLAFVSSQGLKVLAATKCLTPVVRVVKKRGLKTGSQPWFVVEVALGKTKREMVHAQELSKQHLSDNPQSFILRADDKELEGLSMRC
ncbi:hypothetical protein A7985_19185 [Pseudoalteromonas luteoviolacea]|uniref:Uncharacterized protein n=1 Tax=Pseudoalteromonas luteoviolacea TaxID=43657 RepID=A0A1C0TMX8_9GAMM|nr:hypothetical protein [Pseudoalteromonas luteoviolacea]OCQ20015.1 hypothetical protein A7985_19185 [Pseudoalteromonas luteoviolacea]